MICELTTATTTVVTSVRPPLLLAPQVMEVGLNQNSERETSSSNDDLLSPNQCRPLDRTASSTNNGREARTSLLSAATVYISQTVRPLLGK